MSHESLAFLLRSVNLPSCAMHYQEVASRAESDGAISQDICVTLCRWRLKPDG
jgi:hypothetical protein